MLSNFSYTIYVYFTFFSMFLNISLVGGRYLLFKFFDNFYMSSSINTFAIQANL